MGLGVFLGGGYFLFQPDVQLASNQNVEHIVKLIKYLNY